MCRLLNWVLPVLIVVVVVVNDDNDDDTFANSINKGHTLSLTSV